MKKFEAPVMKLEVIEVEDVITTSAVCDDWVCDQFEPCDWEA